jgi:MFS family permease
LAPLGAIVLVTTSVVATRLAASYKAIELGASALEVGIVGGAFGVLALFTAIPIGLDIDRKGERRYLLAGLALLVIGAIVQMLAANLFALIVGQAILGLGMGGFVVAIQTFAANGMPPPTRDERFAHQAIAGGAGHLCGPVLAGLAIGSAVSDPERMAGLSLAYWVAALLAAVALVITALFVWPTRIPESGTQPRKRIDFLLLLRRPGIPAALMVGLVAKTMIDVLIAYLPLLGEARGIAPAFIGLLLSVRAASGLIARVALPAMLRWLGRARVLFLTLLLAAVAMAGLVLPVADLILLLLIFTVGFGLGVGDPLTSSWMAENAPPNERGSAAAVRVTVNRLGQMLIPPFLGALAVGIGSFAVFFGGAFILFASSLWVRQTEDHD